MSSPCLSASSPSSTKPTRSQKRKAKAERQRLRSHQAARSPHVASAPSFREPYHQSADAPPTPKAPAEPEHMTWSTHQLINSCNRDYQVELEGSLLREQPEDSPRELCGWELVQFAADGPGDAGSSGASSLVDKANIDLEWELVSLEMPRVESCE